jgi:hypothetical protein
MREMGTLFENLSNGQTAKRASMAYGACGSIDYFDLGLGPMVE